MVGSYVVGPEFRLEFGSQVTDSFNNSVSLRLGDLPPSVMAAIWHDADFDHADAEAFREALAQAYFDNCGDDIADHSFCVRCAEEAK